MSMCRRIRKYTGDENWKTCNRWSRSQRREDSLQVATILHAIYDSILNKWPPCMHILSRIPRPHSTHSPFVCFLSSSSLFLHYAVALTILCYIYIIFIIKIWLVDICESHFYKKNSINVVWKRLRTVILIAHWYSSFAMT